MALGWPWVALGGPGVARCGPAWRQLSLVVSVWAAFFVHDRRLDILTNKRGNIETKPNCAKPAQLPVAGCRKGVKTQDSRGKLQHPTIPLPYGPDSRPSD